ncbi:MAG: hypothetical protein AABY22_05145 [Nanoarchaeota archaeon]|mgnify:CR=1 FL=1
MKKINQKTVDIIKQHFTSDAIANEIEGWIDTGYKDSQEVKNLQEAFNQLTGLRIKA